MTTKISFPNSDLSFKNSLGFTDQTTDSKIQSAIGKNLLLHSDQIVKISNSNLDLTNHNIINTNTISCTNANISGNLSVQGTTITANIENTLINDKNLIMNHGGTQSNSVGLLIEKNGVQNQGYILTNEDQNIANFKLKHPDSQYYIQTPIFAANQSLLSDKNMMGVDLTNQTGIMKLNLGTLSVSNNIDFSSVKNGSNNFVAYFDGTGQLNSEQTVSKTRGGFGQPMNTVLTGNLDKIIKYNGTTQLVELSDVPSASIANNTITTAMIQNYQVSLDKLKNGKSANEQGAFIIFGEKAGVDSTVMTSTTGYLYFMGVNSNFFHPGFQKKLRLESGTYFSADSYVFDWQEVYMKTLYGSITYQENKTVFMLKPGSPPDGRPSTFSIKVNLIGKHMAINSKEFMLDAHILINFDITGQYISHNVIQEIVHRKSDVSDIEYSFDYGSDEFRIFLKNNINDQNVYSYHILMQQNKI